MLNSSVEALGFRLQYSMFCNLYDKSLYKVEDMNLTLSPACEDAQDIIIPTRNNVTCYVTCYVTYFTIFAAHYLYTPRRALTYL